MPLFHNHLQHRLEAVAQSNSNFDPRTQVLQAVVTVELLAGKGFRDGDM